MATSTGTSDNTDTLTTGQRHALVQKGHALPGGRFPIPDVAHLDKAILAVGRTSPNTDAARATVRRFIIKRAKALKATSHIPDSWMSDGSLKTP